MFNLPAGKGRYSTTNFQLSLITPMGLFLLVNLLFFKDPNWHVGSLD
jgi:hypothetical protein